MSNQNSTQNPAVVLGIDRNDLGKFIANLLGQRRSTERRIVNLDFAIDLDWICNLDRMIQQRIEGQNDAKLVSFQAKIGFTDGSMEILTSREALIAFMDISKRISSYIDIRYSYLVKFPTAEISEKQDIRFYAISGEKNDEGVQFSNLPESVSDDAEIYYSISFSNFTWGSDMNHSLSGLVESSFQKKNVVERFVKSFISPITLMIIFASLAMAILIKSMSSLSGNIQKIMPEFNKIKNDYISGSIDKLEYINRKTDHIIESNGAIELFPEKLPFIIMFCSLTLIIVSLVSYVHIRPPSSVIVNSNTRSRYNKKKKTYDFVKYGIAVAFFLGVGSGVFANKVTKLLEQNGMF